MDNYEKEQMRKDVLDELNGNGKGNPNSAGGVIESFGPTKKKSAVSFSADNKVESYHHEEKKEERPKPPQPTNDKKSNSTTKVVLVICVLLVIVGIAFFPTIFDKINDYKNSKLQKKVRLSL